MKHDPYDAARVRITARVITGWKVRDHGRDLEVTSAQGDFRGIVISEPKVGKGLDIYRLAERDILRTSTVRGVSVDPDGAVRVETVNSTYRLVFDPSGSAVDEAA